jgi:hypothetical protein
MAQRRQIRLHDVPKPIFANSIVFVPNPVTQRPYLMPWLIRHESGSKVTEFGSGLANPFEAPLNGIIGLTIFLERHQIHASGVAENGLGVLDDIF